jgi:hypothetical protein
MRKALAPVGTRLHKAAATEDGGEDAFREMSFHGSGFAGLSAGFSGDPGWIPAFAGMSECGIRRPLFWTLGTPAAK